MVYVYEPRQFIVDFRNGQLEALEYTYNQFSQPLYYYIKNKCWDEEMSSSIVAESFLKLYRRVAHFESLDQIKRWLYIVSRNLFIDVCRNKQRMPIVGNIVYDVYSEYEKPHAYEFMSNTGDSTNLSDIEIEMMKSLVLQKMLEEINNLPRQRRIILKLYFFEEKTTHEIMKITGLCQQTVLNHKTRAIDALKYKFLQQGITCAL
jgi:RNA polymerase sigma-70 factor (ECF subfamily)